MHSCDWHPDGKIRCGEPASKHVLFEVSSGQFKTVWLCDEHYESPEVKKRWENAEVKWAVKPIY
jgi:hypothetical protein